MELWCDAKFAACNDTRRSTTGWVATMNGAWGSWESSKEQPAAALTMDAESQAGFSVIAGSTERSRV